MAKSGNSRSNREAKKPKKDKKKAKPISVSSSGNSTVIAGKKLN